MMSKAPATSCNAQTLDFVKPSARYWRNGRSHKDAVAGAVVHAMRPVVRLNAKNQRWRPCTYAQGWNLPTSRARARLFTVPLAGELQVYRRHCWGTPIVWGWLTFS